MNLIFSVFVSRPPPPLPPITPRCSSGSPRVHPSSHRHRHQDHLYQSLSPRACPSPSLSRSFLLAPLPLPRSEGSLYLYVSSVRIYLSSVVRFHVIKLARAASLGFYLSEKKRINFERRRRFSVRYSLSVSRARARAFRTPTGALSARYYLLSGEIGRQV